MFIESIELLNYRNYKQLHMDFHSGTDVYKRQVADLLTDRDPDPGSLSVRIQHIHDQVLICIGLSLAVDRLELAVFL